MLNTSQISYCSLSIYRLSVCSSLRAIFPRTFICRLSFVRSAPWQSTPLADVDNALFPLLVPKISTKDIYNSKRRRSMEALALPGRMWYTKLVPTLHGGGSFCSPYTSAVIR